MLNIKDLEKIYASAPDDQFQFEVVRLYAPWYTQPYYVQYAIEDFIDVVIDGVLTEVMYAPVRATRASSNEELTYDRSFTIETVNDILARESTRFDPDVHNPQDLKITTWDFISYEDGSFSDSTPGQVLNVPSSNRDITGTTFNASTKPTNMTATGEINSNSRSPMQRGML
jgi:hypothetical protein